MNLNLKEALFGKGWTGKLLVHKMDWFGEPNHVHRVPPNYNSSDPLLIARQLTLMQECGIDGVISTWQGPTKSFGHGVAIETSQQCAERNMLFCLLMDPAVTKTSANKEQAVISAIQEAGTQKILNSPSYIPEKAVLDFDTKANFALVSPSTPGISYWKRHSEYSWPEITNTIPTLASDNARPTMKIPGLCLYFNDAGAPLPDGTRDYCKWVWGLDKPCRVIEHQAGKFIFDQVDVTPKTTPYGALITWNDHDEGTGIEQFLSMITGIRIVR